MMSIDLSLLNIIELLAVFVCMFLAFSYVKFQFSCWWQSKIRPENASTSQERLFRIRSLLLPITPEGEPQSEVNIEEELRSDYVKRYREIYDKEKVPEEKLVAAIKYLNRLKGGLKAQRSPCKLISAIKHMDIMRSNSRMGDSGFPRDYSPEELLLILVDSGKYHFIDVLRVLKNHLETNSFPPSPEEFADLYHKMKVQLEKALEKYQRVVGAIQRWYSQLLSDICSLSAQANRSRCKICWYKEVQVVFLPCTHMVTCEGCVSTLHDGRCPICYQNIQNQIQVLFA
uniref:Uncharacterized protein LOC111110400 n=1 Tax=Crassostrea virginica TaxID=6565 RepID=A0A8B8BIE8_CRAVI|nr:uncharacterized protein LOC111110400 [Crassostrea virginica]